MAPQTNQSQAPNDQFRVLIIGRANAGKTSILQRVCDTTESPKIYRLDSQGQRSEVQLDPSIERGLHDIDDELIFDNHDGYIFHDSRGFEAGSEDELKIVQEFVRRKSREKRLKNRLHAIWFCVPMDNDRPSLDVKYFDDICPDKNVPVIALFTKFEQFKLDIKMKLEDEHDYPETRIDAEIGRVFKEHYLGSLSGNPPFICLERMHKDGQRCTDLIKLTANSLSGDVVALMLVAVQKDNLEVSINHAIKRSKDTFEGGMGGTKVVIKRCLAAFPWMWYFVVERERPGPVVGPPVVPRPGVRVPVRRVGVLPPRLVRDRLPDQTQREFEQEVQFEVQEAEIEKQQEAELKQTLSKLQSFVGKWRLSISNENAHHTMIVMIIILEYACRFRTSSPDSSPKKALDSAYSRYKRSGTHKVVQSQFHGSPSQYSISQFTEFIIRHRL